MFIIFIYHQHDTIFFSEFHVVPLNKDNDQYDREKKFYKTKKKKKIYKIKKKKKKKKKN